MKEICIHIPDLEPNQTVELEVRINGKRHHIQYRVEAIDASVWEPDAGRWIDQLRAVIKDYNMEWELVQIGAEVRQVIPVMFRQREKPTA